MRPLHACILAVMVATGTAAAIWGLNTHLANNPPAENFPLETRSARELVGGKAIVFPSRINEPVLRWSIAEQIGAAPEIVLFGSSHGLQLSTDMFSKHHFLNLSVSGAMLSDHLVSTEILVRREKRPKVWIVEVDPWFFNPEEDFQRWHARPDEMAHIESMLSQMAEPALKPIFRQRVSEYVRTKRRAEFSLEPLFHGVDRMMRARFDDPVVADPNLQATVMLPDGSLEPTAEKQQISPDEVRSLAIRQFANAGDRQRFGNFSHLDDGLWRLFERWIQFLQRDGERVVLVLSPYHPAIYPQILAQPNNHLRVLEPKLRELAQRMKLPIIGSYDPAIAGVADADFYDGDHLREVGLTKMYGPAVPEITKGL